MRLLSRLAPVLLTGLLLGALPADATPGPRMTGHGSSQAGARGFAEIAGCISGAENVLVSVVVDESLSLRSTDPKSLRVEGITTAVDSLEQLAAQVGDSTAIQVSLSTFARSYQTLSRWQELTPRSAEKLRALAARTLPGRDAGDATDYRQALLGAKRDLDRRQRQLGDASACKLLLWFTDGALDVDAETGVARQDLCQVGGIADAVRDDGISIIALALFTRGGGVTEQQRNELRAVAEGRAGTATCGTVPIPSDSATGVYLPADDAAALQRIFAGAGALVAGGIEVEDVTCPGAGCARGRYALDIDSGLSGARVLLQGASTSEIRLTSPSGQRVTMRSGQSREIDGATVSYLGRGQLGTLNVSFTPYARERGSWLLEPRSEAELSVYWFWGARLSLETTDVRAGAANEIVVQLLDQDDNPLSLDLYRNARATLTVNGQRLQPRITNDGTLRGEFELPVGDLPPGLPVDASLAVSSSPGGVQLGPIVLNGQLPVTLPPAYPRIRTQEVDFGSLEGLGTVSANLDFDGSALGTTQVCVAGSAISLPGSDRTGDLVRPSPRCVDVPANGEASLELSLSPSSSADGQATGSVDVTMTAADGSEDVQVAVPARLEMTRAVDESTRWALIGLLVAIALLVPAALLVASNLALARFRMTSLARTASKPVRITPTGVESLDGGPLLEPEDFRNATFSGTRQSRKLSLDSTGIVLRGRRILSLKEPVGVATGPAGRILVSAMTPYRGKATNEAPAALGEVDAAFVLLNESDISPTGATGTVVVTVPGNVDRSGIHDRASRLSNRLPWGDILRQAAERARASSSGGATGRDQAAPVNEPAPGLPQGSRTEHDADLGLDDGPPPLPWQTGGTSVPTPAEPARRRRFGRKPKSSPPAGSPAPKSNDDDALPPLPDFLK